MNCPNCGTPAVAGDQFCGNCGTPLGQSAQPTQAMPEQAASYAEPSTLTAPPPAKRATGLIVTLSIAGVLLVAGLGAGGYFGWKALRGEDTQPPADTVATTVTPTTATAAADADEDTDPAPLGFATVEEAVMAEMPDGWVYDMLSNNVDSMEYVTGPPDSEYTDVLVLEKQSDGSWLVTDSYAFDMGDIDGGSSQIAALSPEEEARQVVGEFLYAVKQDRANDAHALTIPPFSEDPASSQYSSGDLKSIEVLDATRRDDDITVWVRSRETWTWGVEEWIYVCVPTEAGYRIRDLLMP